MQMSLNWPHIACAMRDVSSEAGCSSDLWQEDPFKERETNKKHEFDWTQTWLQISPVPLPRAESNIFLWKTIVEWNVVFLSSSRQEFRWLTNGRKWMSVPLHLVRAPTPHQSWSYGSKFLNVSIQNHFSEASGPEKHQKASGRVLEIRPPSRWFCQAYWGGVRIRLLSQNVIDFLHSSKVTKQWLRVLWATAPSLTALETIDANHRCPPYS